MKKQPSSRLCIELDAEDRALMEKLGKRLGIKKLAQIIRFSVQRVAGQEGLR